MKMLECFHRYLYGQEYLLHTGHSTLTQLINLGLVSPMSPTMTNYMSERMEGLHDIHHYAHQEAKVAGDRMKACCDCQATSVGFHRRD